MIDIHCHLLPGIDDGPRDDEQALALARALEADGIRFVVCTPHIYPGVFDNTRTAISERFSHFQQVAQSAGITLELSFGSEVRLSPELLLWARQGQLPFLVEERGGKALLVELPDGQVPLGTDKLVYQLVKMGIQPVVVHPERNKQIMAKPAIVEALVDAGACLQVTASSVIGEFGRSAQSAAEFMLKNEWVTVIASDSHNTKGRAPKMSAARSWIQTHYGPDAVHRLFVEGPSRLCGIPA